MTTVDESFNWKPLLQKTWVIVLAGLFVPPVGMILAWLKPDWTTRTRFIATGLMLLLLIGRIGSWREQNTGGGEEQASVSPVTDGDTTLATSTTGGRSEDYQGGYNLGKAHAESMIRAIEINMNAMKEHGPIYQGQVNEALFRLRQAIEEVRVKRDSQRQGLGNALDHYEGRYDGLVKTAAPYL